MQLLKEVSEQNVSLAMRRRRFRAMSQCPHSHPFCAFLSPCQTNDKLRSFQSSFFGKILIFFNPEGTIITPPAFFVFCEKNI